MNNALKIMSNILGGMLVFTLIFFNVFGNEENPVDFLNKVISNLGGKIVKDSLKWNYEVHIKMIVDSSVDGVKHVKIREWFKWPDKRKTEYEVKSEKIDIIYRRQDIIKGREAWTKEGNAPPKRNENVRPAEFQPWKFLIGILDGKQEIGFLDKDSLNNLWILKTTSKSDKSHSQIIYFNAKYLPVKRESSWDGNKKEMNFIEFDTINGLYIPIRYLIYNDFINEKEKIEVTFTKIEFGPNLKLSESVFVFNK